MKKTIKTDLTVIGGGIAGICTAIAAARNGIQVALINDRDVPGGNASSENRIHINGGATGNSSYYSRESGIADELKLFTLFKNPRYNKKKDFHLSDMAILEMILAEPNLKYFPSTSVYDIEKSGDKITKVFGFKSKTQDNYCFESPIFCDASGDGLVAFLGGAKFRVGREACDEFNESLAPEVSDSGVMGSCILFNVKHEGKHIEYKKPSFAYDLVEDGIIKYFERPETGRTMPVNGGDYNGMWWLEVGGLQDTIKEADDIDFELKKLIYGYWDYIKNSGKYPDADDCSIDWIAPYAAKRESRRFMGEYIMKQSDIQNSIDFADAVSTGGWSLDIHDVGGLYGTEKTSAFGEVKSMYNIPLSIMYTRDIDNLFLAGRIVSCTHVALGSIRVMETLGAMGQAVGTAAALCKKYNAMPDEIDKKYISELQASLQKDGQFIIGMKEDCGKAKDAKICVSSTSTLENTDADVEIKLDKGVIYTIPNFDDTNIIEVKIKNNSDSDQDISCEIFGEDSIKNYRLGKLLSNETLKIEKGFDGYKKINIAKTDGNKTFIKLGENNNLSVFGAEKRLLGCPSFYGNFLRVYNGSQAVTLTFKGVDKSKVAFCKKNLINGFSRVFGAPNVWVSDGKKSQWLELEFEKPIDISQIQIYFNPQYENDHFDEQIKSIISDYDLSVLSGAKTYTTEVRENCITRNCFDEKYKNVSKIRFDLLNNRGTQNFEVFAVKVF